MGRIMKNFLFFLLLVVLFMFLAAGCDSESRAVVDFSNTIAETQRQDDSGKRPLKAAVGAMVSPQETHEIYRQLFLYVSRRVGRELELVQRKTYAEVNELLGKKGLDLAFICSGPYVSGRKSLNLELLAAPQVQGGHVYRSYLIVKKTSPFTRLEDLKDRTFAFTDPASNTGRMAPTFWLAQLGERPESFFKDVIYTYSHDNSILAVARGLVDGAAVDSLIWDYYQEKDPVFTSKTKVIRRSEPFGIPPIVVPQALDPELKKHLRDIFFNMHMDPEGRQILSSLMIDRFIQPQDDWYQSVEVISRFGMHLAGSRDEFEKP